MAIGQTIGVVIGILIAVTLIIIIIYLFSRKKQVKTLAKQGKSWQKSNGTKKSSGGGIKSVKHLFSKAGLTRTAAPVPRPSESILVPRGMSQIPVSYPNGPTPNPGAAVPTTSLASPPPPVPVTSPNAASLQGLQQASQTPMSGTCSSVRG